MCEYGLWGQGFSPPPVPTLVSPLPHFSMSLYLNWPQLPADRPCVQDRQRDDASWFNYVYNIALFLINSSHSLQSPWDLIVWEGRSCYWLLLLIDCGRTRKCPISNITLKPPLKPNQQELEGIQQLSLHFFLVRTVSMHYLMSV